MNYLPGTEGIFTVILFIGRVIVSVCATFSISAFVAFLTFAVMFRLKQLLWKHTRAGKELTIGKHRSWPWYLTLKPAKVIAFIMFVITFYVVIGPLLSATGAWQ